MIEGYDLVILGCGTTAFAAARRAADMGAKVVMVEHSKVGGTTVNWGCIPSKILIEKATLYHEARRGQPFGLNLTAEYPDCPTLMDHKDQTVERLRLEHFTEPLDDDGRIHVMQGHGRFLSPNQLQVGAEILVADKFIIATGGTPRVLPIPGLETVRYLTSYSACQLPCFPESLVILGGGVVALEMGQMFARFGTRVTILERGDRLLSEFDTRLTTVLGEIVRQEGVTISFNTEIQEVWLEEGGDTGIKVKVADEEKTLIANKLMLAVGTTPATDDIGLEAAGVETDERGFIITNDKMQTNVPHICAAGDCNGPPLIAPIGEREGEVAAVNLLKPETNRTVVEQQMPMAVFVDPELAKVGWDVAQSKAEGRTAMETFLELDQVAKSHVMGNRRGGILLTSERGTGQVLGVQILAPGAADIIHQAAMAVRFGLNVRDLAETVHVYPTIADGLRMAAQENLRMQRQQGYKVPGSRCICF